VTPVLVEKVPGLTVKSAGRQPVSKPPVCGIEAPVGVVVPAAQALLTISSKRSGVEGPVAILTDGARPRSPGDATSAS
jgi:hypothetical protein